MLCPRTRLRASMAGGAWVTDGAIIPGVSCIGLSTLDWTRLRRRARASAAVPPESKVESPQRQFRNVHSFIGILNIRALCP